MSVMLNETASVFQGWPRPIFEGVTTSTFQSCSGIYHAFVYKLVRYLVVTMRL